MTVRYSVRVFWVAVFMLLTTGAFDMAHGFSLSSGTLTRLISDFPGTLANALRYDGEKFGFKINGYGTAGLLEPDFETPYFINDWRVRGEFNYHPGANTFGLVYAIDADIRYYVDIGSICVAHEFGVYAVARRPVWFVCGGHNRRL